MIFDLIQEYNQECSFTDSIEESCFIEKKIQYIEGAKIQSKNHILCILSKYDPMYQILPKDDKKSYLKKRIFDISSEIEDKSDTCYSNYNFNEKLMKPSTIQMSFQLSEHNKNTISSLYYLNEYLQKHFVIIHNNKYYETTLKDYPRDYISITSHGYSFQESLTNETKGIFNELFTSIPIINDLKKDLRYVYKMPLELISKYKMDELKQIAQEYNLSLKDGKKNKVKQILYDEINLWKLNH